MVELKPLLANLKRVLMQELRKLSGLSNNDDADEDSPEVYGGPEGADGYCQVHKAGTTAPTTEHEGMRSVASTSIKTRQQQARYVQRLFSRVTELSKQLADVLPYLDAK